VVCDALYKSADAHFRVTEQVLVMASENASSAMSMARGDYPDASAIHPAQAAKVENIRAKRLRHHLHPVLLREGHSPP